MISEGIFNLIVTNPSVADIVSGGGSPPMYSVHHGSLRKSYTLPAIRMSAVTTTPIITTDGTAPLLYQRWQFDSFASTYLDAHRLNDALKDLLTDYAGTLCEGTVIRSTFLRMELDSPLEEGKAGYVFRCVVDYEFAYEP
jgi:hypothetical protein